MAKKIERGKKKTTLQKIEEVIIRHGGHRLTQEDLDKIERLKQNAKKEK